MDEWAVPVSASVGSVWERIDEDCFVAQCSYELSKGADKIKSLPVSLVF